MKLTVLEIEAISRSIVREYDDLSIAGVTAADGEADHAELLVAIAACHEDPCMVLVSVPRGDREEMERALRDCLRTTVTEHRLQA